jgi:dienelactone hydrolase
MFKHLRKGKTMVLNEQRDKLAVAVIAASLMVCVLVAFSARTQSEQQYSVLEAAGLDAKSEEMLFTYLMGAVRACDERRTQEVARLITAQDWEAWGKRVRAEFHRAIGPFPERTPLNARILGVLERDGYRIEKVVFESRPDFLVTANLYIPTGGAGRYPAVLSPCGHTDNGKAGETYQQAYISLVKLGFVVLTYDPLGQGERNEYWDTASHKAILKPGTMQHCHVGNQCYLTGTNLAQYRIWDGMRAIDYLQSRDEVDAARIGVAGNSGGGTLTTYIIALDDRVHSGAPSCYITTLARRVETRGTADAEQNLVGQFPNMLDHADMLIAFAPKPLLICSAVHDFFPIEGAREAYRCLRRAYEAFGVPEKLAMAEADARHGWTIDLRTATYRWFNRWLRGDTSDVKEPADIAVEPDENLYCTPQGQVAYLGSRTVFDMNLDYAKSIRPERDHRAILSNPDQWQANVRQAAIKALRLSDDWNIPGQIHSVGKTVEDGVSVEQLYVQTEHGIVVPSLLFTRAEAKKEMPLIAYVDERGKYAEAGASGLYRRLVSAGCAVLAIDPRGMGETKSRAPSHGGYYGYYGIEADFTYTSFMLDRPLVGMRVYDVMRTVAAVRNRDGIRSDRILCAGTGAAAPIALFAAALDHSLGGALCWKGPISYFSIVATRYHKWHVNCFLPDIVGHLDLPDLGAVVAPRALFIAEPLDGAKETASRASSLKQYALATDVCRNAGRPGNFVLLPTASDEEIVKLIRDWCRAAMQARAPG